MLTGKYEGAVSLLYKVGREVDAREEGGKLHLKGITEYAMDANAVWDQIKTQAGWEHEVVADIRPARTDIFGVYTVQSGDTLSKLAKLHFGDSNRYMDIFNLNKDQLKDPNMIRVGQQLKLPNK